MTSAPAPRLIAHLDMDAFYASVELLRYPELRGRPVVIGGGSRHQPTETIDPTSGERRLTFATLRGYVGRGVITTATYEARALGLRSAMAMSKAADLAPDTVLLPVDAILSASCSCWASMHKNRCKPLWKRACVVTSCTPSMSRPRHGVWPA